MEKILHTKFGTAKIHKNNYYMITSHKEGNNGKLLHRLIYEDFWNVKLPQEIHVHHKDGNKINNCILNLEAITKAEHTYLHMKGVPKSDETKHKLSESMKGENHPFYGKYGKQHPNAKYILWDSAKVTYNKKNMFSRNRKPNPCKCFRLRYKGYAINIGSFHDPLSCEIINDLITEMI